MLLIHCPYCEEERPELEFRGVGEAHLVRSTDIGAETDEAFAEYFFIRANPKGTAFERWRHIHGCGRFFNAVRDTVTDKFLAFYKAGAPRPDIPVPANSDGPMEEGRGPFPADAGPSAWANLSPAEINASEPDASASTGDK